VGWMRMMGAESVEYHRATVLGRVDDHPGRAMEYYASRGETPLVWGGSGASSLDLAGAVTSENYEALLAADLDGNRRSSVRAGPETPTPALASCTRAGREWRSSSPPTRAWLSSA